jgi:hypothetical protein
MPDLRPSSVRLGGISQSSPLPPLSPKLSNVPRYVWVKKTGARRTHRLGLLLQTRPGIVVVSIDFSYGFISDKDQPKAPTKQSSEPRYPAGSVKHA